MKLAPLFLELSGKCEQQVVPTGQHYDHQISGNFFDVLGLPEPDFNLAVGAGSHAEQTANIRFWLEKMFWRFHPRQLSSIVM